MARVVDFISIMLLFAAGAAFALGVHALGDQRDLKALYWLAIGALVLRGATDALRPRGAR
jgi:hypothetical protein